MPYIHNIHNVPTQTDAHPPAPRRLAANSVALLVLLLVLLLSACSDEATTAPPPVLPMLPTFELLDLNCSQARNIGDVCEVEIALRHYETAWFGFALELEFSNNAFRLESAQRIQAGISVSLVAAGSTRVEGVNDTALLGSGRFVRLELVRIAAAEEQLSLRNTRIIVEDASNTPSFRSVAGGSLRLPL